MNVLKSRLSTSFLGHPTMNSKVPTSLRTPMHAGLKEKPRRPEHKFNKKPARTKGTRGKVNDGDLVYDGGAMKTGKKGGLVRVA